jgi:hypothetical protein
VKWAVCAPAVGGDTGKTWTGTSRLRNLNRELGTGDLQTLHDNISLCPVSQTCALGGEPRLLPLNLGTAQSLLRQPGDSAGIAKIGMASLRELATRDQAAPRILNQAADAVLPVEPASPRNSAFALACAERAVALNYRQSPSELLILAEAYRAEGQIDQSRATAEEGLALLPPLQPGSVKPNIRKLLEIQAHPGR